MTKKTLYYFYPARVVSSFHLVAKKHIQHLSNYYEIREMDESAFSDFMPKSKVIAILHSALYSLERATKKYDYYPDWFRDWMIRSWRGMFEQLIAFDVCDSDRISDYAVSLFNITDKVAVPSTFCNKVFRESGVKTKVYTIPHGVDREWYELPNVWLQQKVSNPQLLNLYEYKKRTGKKILLFWQWYSTPRKGWNEVVEVYKKLRKQRNDVILVIKTGDPTLREFELIRDIEHIKVWGWFNDDEKMALYDLADITLLFSHGGGFEINCLESLARGIPCLSHDYGSWLDYQHPRFLIKRGKKVQVMPGALIHNGYGYTVDVEDAVAKINEVLDNLDEYKLIAEDHRQKLKETFVWDKIGEMIVKMIEE